MSKIRSRNSAESALKSVSIKSNDGKHEIDLVSSVTELCYLRKFDDGFNIGQTIICRYWIHRTTWWKNN